MSHKSTIFPFLHVFDHIFHFYESYITWMTHKLWVMKNDVISKSHMTSWILSKKIKSIHPCGSAKERFKGKNVFLSTTTTWYFFGCFFPKAHSTGYDLSYESWLMVYDSRNISIWTDTKFQIFREKNARRPYAIVALYHHYVIVFADFFPKAHSTGHDLSYESWLMVYDSRNISIWTGTKFLIFRKKNARPTYANRLQEFLNICGV